MTSSVATNILVGSHIGAHHPQAADGAAASLPSIFDYLAQDSLRQAMKPGLRAAIKLIAQQRFPRFGSFVERRFDELFLLFEAMLQNHYLRKFSGSFAEHFYGLKRVPISAGATLALFRHRFRSLLALVLLPYLAEKMEKWHEKLETSTSSSQNRTWGHRTFLRLFPRLKAILLAAILLFQLGYSFSWLPVPSPLLLLAGCRLEKLGQEDLLLGMQAANGQQTPWNVLRKSGSIFAFLLRLLLWLPSAVGSFLSYGLYLLQFLEHCYTDDLGKHFAELMSKQQRIRVPEYPFQSLPSEQQVLCMETDKCPLCKRTRRQDTVLSVSGYVFCHPCIYNFVLLHGRCPVTSLAASTNELVKIYH